MVEYEKKILLTAEEYMVISMMLCKGIVPKIQTNYYFDDDAFSMNEKHVTCRIRTKDGTYTATMKKHNLESSDCSVEMDLIEKKEFDPRIFNVFGIHYQGQLVTERTLMYKDSTCKMVLDRNVYLGHEDFELEVEYRKGYESEALKLMGNIAGCLVTTKLLANKETFFKRIGQGGSKSQRFFELLKKSQ